MWGDYYYGPGADLIDGGPGEGDNVVGIERLSMYVVGDFTGTDGPIRSSSSTRATPARRA
jgi:hypothetical protein